MRSPANRFRCPLIFLVAGFIALFALGLQDSSMILNVALAILFVAPYAIPLRIPESLIPIWTVRSIVYAAIYSLTRSRYTGIGDDTDPHFVFVLGELAASEMVMQCWRERPTGKTAGLGLIMFAGLAYMGACYVFDSTFIPWLSPAFFAVLVLSWRRIKAQTLHDPMSTWAMTFYVLATLLSVGIGGGTFWAVNAGHDRLNRLFLNAGPSMDPSGMSAQPQLGSSFEQSSTQRVLLLTGEPSDPHLRALAFNYYNGGYWGPLSTSRSNVPVVNGILGSAHAAGKAVLVKKLAYASGFYYFPLNTEWLDVGGDGSADWCQSEGGPVLSRQPPPNDYSFSVDNGADFTDPSDEPKEIAADLVVPHDIVPAVITLTKAVVAHRWTDDEKVQAIAEKLDGDHAYSLTYSASPGDPISGFILGKKPSFCEYFASATVIMMRIAHIPARYVTGYYAHERDHFGHIVVRQRDAHAWAEGYYDGKWHTIDTTPAGGRPDALPPVPVWQTWLESAQDDYQYLQNLAARVGPVKIAFWTALVVGFYFLLRLILKDLRARLKSRNQERINDPQLSVHAKRFADFLSRYAVEVTPGETWQEVVAAAEQLPFDRQLALQFIDRYYSERFGAIRDDGLEEIMSKLEVETRMETKV